MVDKVDKKTWGEFKDIGLLWFVNRFLHLFGWVIVLEYEDNVFTGTAYPARSVWRGFEEEIETNGFIKLTEYLAENIQDLLEEARS